MIYRIGGGVRKEEQVVGGERREYYMIRTPGKKMGGIWRRIVVEAAGTRGGQACMSVGFSWTGCNEFPLWGNRHSSIKHLIMHNTYLQQGYCLTDSLCVARSWPAKVAWRLHLKLSQKRQEFSSPGATAHLHLSSLSGHPQTHIGALL